MKKSIVVVLVLLALVVFISPGLVGHLAERSVTANIESTAQQGADIRVTTEDFDGGWFSSAGRHRVELTDPALVDGLGGLLESRQGLPTLLIDTHIDHGLIPVTSMQRDGGSLRPGLGNAVSTLSLELANGEVIALPGSVYTHVTLSGGTASKYAADAGTRELENGSIAWGETSLDVDTDPGSGKLDYDGSIASLAVNSGQETLALGTTAFSGTRKATPYGFAVGDIKLRADSVIVGNDGSSTRSVGPLALEGESTLDDGRVSGNGTISIGGIATPNLGTASIDAELRVNGADAAALQRLDSVDEGDEAGARDAMLQLVQRGIEINVPRLVITSDDGRIESDLALSVAEDVVSDWSSALLHVDAALNLSVPESMIGRLLADDQRLAAAVGLGYLQLRGDAYVTEVRMSKGVLTVNGAPQALPIF